MEMLSDRLKAQMLSIDRPHSLGNPIEWKHTTLLNCLNKIDLVPTRWGTQLNGNPIELS